MSILIVDDSLDDRLLMNRYMQGEGYLCHTAPSGEWALEVLATEAVELALLDIIMPGMTGLNLFEHIRQRYPDVAVIFVTSLDDVGLAVRNLKWGAFDYLVKPYTRKRLQQSVKEALEKRNAMLDERHQHSLMEEKVSQQSQELQSRVGELSSLNRMFQADLAKSCTTDRASFLKVENVKELQIRRSMMSLHESVKERNSDHLHGHVQSKLLELTDRLRYYKEMMAQDPQKASAFLEQIRSELETVQEDDIRRASHELYPSIVKLGLVHALRALTDRLGQAVPIELSIDPEIHMAEEHNLRLFPEEYKVGIYRIVEEALDNVIKYAYASNAKVEMHRRDNGYLSLAITDDGRGFEAGNVVSAFGLLAMKDYAEALGGDYHIESTPGDGTRVAVRVRDPSSTHITQQERLEVSAVLSDFQPQIHH